MSNPTRIELKNCIFRLVDGYSNTAMVNDSPIAEDTEVEIDTVGDGGIIPVSTRFTVVGSADQYTVLTQDANAQISIDLNSAISGSGDLTIAGADSTIPIAFDDTATEVLASLEADANIEAGDFTVTGAGTMADPFLITATSAGAYGNIAVVMSFAQGTLDTAPVSTQTYDGGETHHITFSPAFVTGHVPVDDAVITISGRTAEVRVGEGNMTHDINKAFLYDLDRGRLDTVREDDEAPLSWTLDLVWDFLRAFSGVETPTIYEAFNQIGPAASWISYSDNECEPYAVALEIERIPRCADEPIETTLIPDARYETLAHDVDEATISASGQANTVLPIVTQRENVSGITAE